MQAQHHRLRTRGKKDPAGPVEIGVERDKLLDLWDILPGSVVAAEHAGNQALPPMAERALEHALIGRAELEVRMELLDALRDVRVGRAEEDVQLLAAGVVGKLPAVPVSS